MTTSYEIIFMMYKKLVRCFSNDDQSLILIDQKMHEKCFAPQGQIVMNNCFEVVKYNFFPGSQI